MAGGVIDELISILEGDRALARVEEDPVLSAELILLFHMILADGETTEPEIETLRRICRDAFGIEGTGFDHVVEHLQEASEDTGIASALAMFRHLDDGHKKRLARHMAEIAHVDERLQPQEQKLLARTLELLDLKP